MKMKNKIKSTVNDLDTIGLERSMRLEEPRQ